MTLPSMETQWAAPYVQEAEEAVLGAILIDPNCFRQMAAIIQVEDFYLLRSTYIWQAFDQLARDEKPADYLLVCEALRASGHLEDVGGSAYLTHLVNKTPTSIHAQMYAELVKAAATRRHMLVASEKLRALALDESLTVADAMGEAQKHFLDIQTRIIQNRGEPVLSAMNVLMDKIEKQGKAKSNLIGIPSGLVDLDNLLGGFEKQDLIVLAGRPGMGKSALVLNIALNAARAGYKIALFLQEMSKEEALRRWLAMETSTNSQVHKRPASMNELQWSNLWKAAGDISKLPIWIDDRPLCPREMTAICEYRKHSQGLDLILSDGMYRQPTDYKVKDEFERYSHLAVANKTMAKLLDLPVLTTHQLNRSLEDRKDKRPILSDLRGSGRIEEEADIVAFLYRDAVYNEASEWPNQCDIIIEKNRDGSTGTVPTYFEKSFTRFQNAVARRVDLKDTLIPAPRSLVSMSHEATGG